MYDSETWVLREKKIKMLSIIWERTLLRKIYGDSKFSRRRVRSSDLSSGMSEGKSEDIWSKEWKIWNNQELRNMYGQPDIIEEIKSKRLEWLGHVVRIEGNRMVKRVFKGHPGGRRKTGRPRKRWMDDIEEGLRLMEVKRWRKNNRETSLGKKSFGRPRPYMGCSAKE
jgi:hypothetical protein